MAMSQEKLFDAARVRNPFELGRRKRFQLDTRCGVRERRLEIAAPDRLNLIGDRPQVIRVMPGIDIHVGRTPPLRPRIFANALCCAGGVFRFHCWSGLYGRTPGF